jgi:hypothetical protein
MAAPVKPAAAPKPQVKVHPKTEDLNLGGDPNEDVEQGSEHGQPSGEGTDAATDASGDKTQTRLAKETGTAQDPVKAASKQVKAARQLKEIGEMMGSKSEDKLHNDFGFHRYHAQEIREMLGNKAKGKLTNFSDGKCEMLDIQYNRLVKAKKLIP